MKISTTFAIIAGLAAVATVSSCKNTNQDGYSDTIETLQYPADDSTTTVTDTLEVNGLSTINKSTKGSSGTDEGGTTTGSGPGESPKDGATYSGPTERHQTKDSTNAKKK
jgi:hypothetical protein